MSQVGQELVCQGAVCRCDKGTAPSALQITSPHNSYLQGKLVATTQDKTFAPFGSCALKNNNPCVPALLEWQGAFELVEVNSPARHPLLEKSTIKCAVGGQVSIIDTLQVAVPGQPAPARAEAVRAVFLSLCPLLLTEPA
jgi:hypothetical protein